MKKDKAKLDLNLARAEKVNKSFYMYVSQKRKVKEGGPLNKQRWKTGNKQ